MTLYIVRHGRTEANAGNQLLGRADPPLDPLGRKQADALAAALPAGVTVVSSPLRRCRETAAAIGAAVRVDERFIELDYGEYDLKPLHEVEGDVWTRWRADPDFRLPGGETLTELGQRVGAGLDELVPAAADGDVVVVTHVSPVKAAVAWALGVGIGVSWRCFVAQASLTVIGCTDRGPSLRLFNSEAHLLDLTA
ncbi:MAG: histidine phosphatase family protein [Acidimicrobiales bacterium]